MEDVTDGAGAPAAETAETAEKAEPSPTKQERAHAIYLNWRNARLGGLPTGAFAMVEAASGALVSAIAAEL